MAGEIVTLWWGLFDHGLFVEHADQRFGPFGPINGPIPLYCYASLLGATMVDVGTNDASFWHGIPEQVWECRIGGYQVPKKWLSYRDHSMTARPLSAEEIGHVQQVARRIAAVLLLGPVLDASHQDCVLAHG